MTKKYGVCVSQHRVLLVEQWTPLGAFVSCLCCGAQLHAERPHLDTHYAGFEHTSMRGPEHDQWVFIYNQELEDES